MNSYTETGVLVLADISGFTEFVTATELEHGPAVIAELLGEVMRQLSPPLEIQEVEGDAVFALAADPVLDRSTGLLAVLEDAFAAFKSRQRDLEADDSCNCAACRSVGNLDLKIVAHHGRFLRQQVGGRSQAAGANVVLAHRLLKNGLPGRAYILLTEAALRRAGLSPGRAGLLPHTERYEHFGDVRCFVKPLDAPAALPEPATAA
jgi:class 3 adenylate cyclase